MVWIPWAAVILYLVIWLFCLIHCWRQKEIYRPFNIPAWLMKAIWAAYFLTSSPFALLAYIPFGLILKHKESRGAIAHGFAALSLAVLFCLAILFFLDSQTPYPVTWKKNNMGDWVEMSSLYTSTTDEEFFQPLFQFEAHYGVYASSNNKTTTTSSNSGSFAKFACHRVIVLLENDHLLLWESAKRMAESLREFPFLDAIEILPAGAPVPSGGLLPDMWIRIGMRDYKESYFPPRTKIEAQIVMQVSSQFARSNHGYVETYSVPAVHYLMKTDLQYSSQAAEIRTSSAKYHSAAKDIGAELAKPVVDLMKEYRAKYQLPPKEMDELTPSVESAPANLVPMLAEIEPAAHGTRPLTVYQSCRVIDAGNRDKKLFARLAQELEAAGWRKQDFSPQGHSPYLRYATGQERIEGFVETEPFSSYGTKVSSDKDISNATRFVVNHEIWMNSDEVRAKLKGIMDRGCSIDFLLMMKGWIWNDPSIRDQYKKALEESPVKSAMTFLELAAIWESMGDAEQQWIALKKAEAMEKIIGGEDANRSQIEYAQKEFTKKHPDFVPAVKTAEIYESLGVKPMPNEGKMEMEAVVEAGQPLAFYRIGEDGKVFVLSAFMIPNPLLDSESPYALRLRMQENGGSESTSGGNLEGRDRKYYWRGSMEDSRYNFTAESQMLDERQFKIKAAIKPVY
ncbi:MAG: hypothetical protein AB1656_22740 [Candidatus Omnitrophota bacterium]